MARLSVLFSGSDGNCTYIRYGDNTLLIDAGVSAKRLTGKLEENGVPLSSVQGILITHEHIDHVRGLRVFAGKNHIPIYGNRPTLSALKRAGNLPEEVSPRELVPGTTETIAGMIVTPFCTSHDAVMSMGYRITTPDGRTAAYVTDLGIFSDEVFQAVDGAHTVVLESNHDRNMLRHGPYPPALQERVAGVRGHLANDQAAEAAVRLIRAGTGRIILAHVSTKNNTPRLAIETVGQALAAAGSVEGRNHLLFVAGKEDGREYIY